MHSRVGLDGNVGWPVTCAPVRNPSPGAVRKPDKLLDLAKVDFGELVLWSVVGAHLEL